MPISRIYQPEKIIEGAEMVLDARASHHLIHVLRSSLNTPIILFNGQGGEFSANITRIEKKKVFVNIESFSPVSRESNFKIHLAQAISKTDKMDLVMQKATELGVTSITPIITKRCSVKLSKERQEKRLLHWQNIIVSACEQCGRNELPQLNAPVTFENWITQAHLGLRVTLQPGSIQTVYQLKPVRDITLLIGGEGGLTDAETTMAEQYDFELISLGPRVLRTETAPLAAIAILQAVFGDLR